MVWRVFLWWLIGWKGNWKYRGWDNVTCNNAYIEASFLLYFSFEFVEINWKNIYIYMNSDSVYTVELFLKFCHCSNGKIDLTTDRGEEEVASTTSFVNCDLITRNFCKTCLAILTRRCINLLTWNNTSAIWLRNDLSMEIILDEFI